MNPTRCGTVWVELGPTPDLDRLQECTRVDCADHQRQLAWVNADVGRFLAYAAQLRRYTLRDQGRVEELSLLP